jgi:hypothetical protein
MSTESGDITYLLYKSHEPTLVKAFEESGFLPEIDSVTHSDIISNGSDTYTSRVKISFTKKSGTFMRAYMYIPGSMLSKQAYLSDSEKTAVEFWLQSVKDSEASFKESRDNKVGT